MSKKVVSLLSSFLVFYIFLAGCEKNSGSSATPLADAYAIGGTVSGLEADTHVVIQINGRETLTIAQNGEFLFDHPFARETIFVVLVSAHPDSKVCKVNNGVGKITDHDITDVAIECVNSYFVGGTISGLSDGKTMILQNNFGESLTLTRNEPFQFNTKIALGSNYKISVAWQPLGQYCTVTRAEGVMPEGTVANIEVTCELLVGIRLGGLVENQKIVLQNNAAGQLALTQNGEFFFTTASTAYNVSILTPPTKQQCSIAGGDGTIDIQGDYPTVRVLCTLPLEINLNPLSGEVVADWSELRNTSYDLLYTTDPNCDFNNVASCVDGTQMTAVHAPIKVNSLRNGTLYYFALKANYSDGHVRISRISSVMPEVIITNRTVKAIATAADGTVYIGGDFNMLGARSGGGVPLHKDYSGPISTQYAMVDGVVYASASDGNGGFYIGGAFSHVGGVARNNIAHILADGTLDTVWNPTANSTIYALVVANNILYVGGAFTHIGYQPRNGVAALDTNGTTNLWNPDIPGTVHAIALFNDKVYVGGIFSSVGTEKRANIAAIDASGMATAWNPGADAGVFAIVASTNSVFIGGRFTHVGGVVRHYIAAFNENGVLSNWNPNANREVESLLYSNDKVYVGGAFTLIGDQSRNNLAQVDAKTGIVTPWDANIAYFNGATSVVGIAESGGTIYCVGKFYQVGGKSRHQIVAFDTEGWITSWNPAVTYDSVYTVSTSGNSVYVGGSFKNLGWGAPRAGLAALDANGQLTSWAPFSGYAKVNTLAISDNLIFIGGDFAFMENNRLFTNIIAVDSAGYLSQWNPAADGVVSTIKVTADKIFVGGNFTNIGGQKRGRIAALDKSGRALPWNPSADGHVRSLLIWGDMIYAAGDFTRIGGQDRNYLAALNASGGATGWNPNPNARVLALEEVDFFTEATATTDSLLLAGGEFTNIGGQNHSHLAALDLDGARTTSPLVTSPIFDSTEIVYALKRFPNGFFAGSYSSTGYSTTNKLTTTSSLIAFNQIHDLMFKMQYNFPLGSRVSAINISGNKIHVGGNFSSYNGSLAGGFVTISQ